MINMRFNTRGDGVHVYATTTMDAFRYVNLRHF